MSDELTEPDANRRLSALEEWKGQVQQVVHAQTNNSIDDARALAALTTRVEKVEAWREEMDLFRELARVQLRALGTELPQPAGASATSAAKDCQGWWVFGALLLAGTAGIAAYEVVQRRARRAQLLMRVEEEP